LRIGPHPPTFIEPFRKGLRELGYVEGQGIVIEYGLAETVAQLPAVASRLVGLKLDVLIASGTPAALNHQAKCRQSAEGRDPVPRSRMTLPHFAWRGDGVRDAVPPDGVSGRRIYCGGFPRQMYVARMGTIPARVSGLIDVAQELTPCESVSSAMQDPTI
jgi:hypothetical protein